MVPLFWSLSLHCFLLFTEEKQNSLKMVKEKGTYIGKNYFVQKLRYDSGILRLFWRSWKENYAFHMRNMTAGLFIKSFRFDMQKYLHISFTTDLTKKLLACSKLSPKHLKWSFRNVYLGRDEKAQTQTNLFYKPLRAMKKKKNQLAEWGL